MRREGGSEPQVLKYAHHLAVEVNGAGQVEQIRLAIDHDRVDSHCTEEIGQGGASWAKPDDEDVVDRRVAHALRRAGGAVSRSAPD